MTDGDYDDEYATVVGDDGDDVKRLINNTTEVEYEFLMRRVACVRVTSDDDNDDDDG